MRWVRWVANIGIVSLLLVILAGPLHRIGLDFRAALGLMALSALVGGIAGLISLIAGFMLKRRGAPAGRVWAGAAAGLIAFAALATLIAGSKGVPPIHDITTDTLDPPQLVAVLPARAATSGVNPAVYGGEKVAAQQTAAYPTIRPLVLNVSTTDAYQKALTAVGAMGWTLVQALPEQGHIEATATTGWFAFKDDVVIRIRAQGAGSRVDIRSVSRVGVGDLGANAKRIEAFSQKLQSE